MAHTAIFLARLLRTGKLGFCCCFLCHELAELRHLGLIAVKGQPYGAPKNGLSEANHLVAGGCQSEALGVVKLPLSLMPRLEKVVAVGGDYGD